MALGPVSRAGSGRAEGMRRALPLLAPLGSPGLPEDRGPGRLLSA